MARARCDWFSLCFSLAEKWRENFRPITRRSNCNRVTVITFNNHLKTAHLVPDWSILVGRNTLYSALNSNSFFGRLYVEQN